ncbi:glycosyltransferase [uncultured Algoriphagus sp.]|uniref:glycosyltransferase family 2 protein n=1 Tax=uncultured Algoriphagus sp. TaxID=417365 RepID=UPI0030EB3E92|tara:strand:+ start:26283 stop:27224 length:942 start_codon:yes stop_codon:yes gene_type:complete
MKFSIGIPAYKEAYLIECISSILSQSYKDFELIIVNDCSPQNVEEIVFSFSDSRIRYFRNEVNCGAENVVDNWNKCLVHATGDFFVLMGDDDKLAPSYLEDFNDLISRYPALDVYHCRSIIINEDSMPIDLTPSWPEYENVLDNIWHRIKSLRQQFISDFLFRTDNLKENDGFYKLPLAWASDDISVYRAIGEKGIAHLNKPNFLYRRNSQTISSGGNSQLKMEALFKEKFWLENFLDNLDVNLDNSYFLNTVLKEEINKYVRKKKIRTITNSYQTGFIKNIQFWFNSRKEFNISFAEIVYSVIERVKQIKSN